MDPAAPPVKQRYYLMPPNIQDINKQVDEFIKKGYIRESNSPWASTILMVPKKNGKWRMCVDYRKLNTLIKKNAWPLPYINDILNQLKVANFVSSIDLVSGYHQIEMDPGSFKYTAFTVLNRGLFEYGVMPFWLIRRTCYDSRFN